MTGLFHSLNSCSSLNRSCQKIVKKFNLPVTRSRTTKDEVFSHQKVKLKNWLDDPSPLTSCFRSKSHEIGNSIFCRLEKTVHEFPRTFSQKNIPVYIYEYFLCCLQTDNGVNFTSAWQGGRFSLDRLFLACFESLCTFFIHRQFAFEKASRKLIFVPFFRRQGCNLILLSKGFSVSIRFEIKIKTPARFPRGVIVNSWLPDKRCKTWQ